MEKDSVPASSNLDYFKNFDLSRDYFTCLLAALRELGGEDDIQALYRLTPSFRAYETGNTPLIAMSDILRTYRDVRMIVEDERLGLLMGQNLKVSSHGLLSNILISAPTFGAALDSLSEFYRLKAPFFKLVLMEGDGDATVSIDFILELDDAIQMLIIDIVAGTACRILEFYGLSGMDDVSIYLDRINSGRVSAYRSELKAMPEKGNSALALKFPLSWLNVNSPLANAELFSMAVMSCYDISNHRGEPSSFSEEVENLFLDNPARSWTQTALAEHFHISPSTLGRRLSECGTTYKKLDIAAKVKSAKQLLIESKLHVTEISHVLGYTDSSNFATAFRRSTGMSPSEFRTLNDKLPGR